MQIEVLGIEAWDTKTLVTTEMLAKTVWVTSLTVIVVLPVTKGPETPVVEDLIAIPVVLADFEFG
jgi:hypothetical protein